MKVKLGIRLVKFVYQGYWLNVRVTGAKKREISSCHPFCGSHSAVSVQLQ